MQQEIFISAAGGGKPPFEQAAYFYVRLPLLTAARTGSTVYPAPGRAAATPEFSSLQLRLNAV